MRSTNFAIDRNQVCSTIFKNRRVCDECCSKTRPHKSAEAFETRREYLASWCKRTKLAAIRSAVRLACSFCTCYAAVIVQPRSTSKPSSSSSSHFSIRTQASVLPSSA